MAIHYVDMHQSAPAFSTDLISSPSLEKSADSMLGAIMAFVRYAHDHQWIDRIPPLRKLDVDEVMRGRPITGNEFEQMLAAVPSVVGDGPAEEWRFGMKILWETGFRLADLLDFSWDDAARIHPVWPRRQGQHPTLVIPSTQKNGKNQEIPMLPGLQKLLDTVPKDRRTGFIVNLLPVEFQFKSQPKKWFMPNSEDLANLIRSYSNCSIARACGVSDVAVADMGQFVNHDVVEDRGRGHHALPMKVQLAAVGAGCPMVLQVNDP